MSIEISAIKFHLISSEISFETMPNWKQYNVIEIWDGENSATLVS